MYHILRGNPQQFLIAPLERRLRELHCEIHLGVQLERIVVEADGAAAVQLRHLQTDRVEVEEVDRLILAIPAERQGRTARFDAASIRAAPCDPLALRTMPHRPSPASSFA
jgi:hypothetical protein